jgi:tRNA threonylcarbamoyladenosine biosynthesis protein TsaE
LKAGSIIFLKGDLGAGKTAFTKSLAAILGANMPEVSSPTFNILQIYQCAAIELWHLDLYRIEELDEIRNLGLEDGFANSITVIEWPDIIEQRLKASNIIRIAIEFEDDELLRKIRIY